MKSISNTFIFLTFFFAILGCSKKTEDLLEFVNPMNGTMGRGAITPVAVRPYGMMQLGPDTRQIEDGYDYNDSSIIGFSHLHKSGGGCNDFLDILFQPFIGENKFDKGSPDNPGSGYRSRFSHSQEKASVGRYEVKLLDYNIDVALTTTKRCGMHHYCYPEDEKPKLIVDLKHGSVLPCTIVKEDEYDTVMASGLKILDKYKIEGYRISTGWVKEQHVYFAAVFSQPISNYIFYDNGKIVTNRTGVKGTDVRLIVEFPKDNNNIYVKVGISSVGMEGAWQNLKSEMPDWDFDRIVEESRSEWLRELSKIQIQGGTTDQKTIFYTGLYHTLMYPMLFSDVDGKFRGADLKVHVAKGYDNYAGVVGIRDTYRSSIPLLNAISPEVTSDYIKTMLDHFDYYGLLPVWILWGCETFTMLGYHALPVISDAYSKGIDGFDAERAYNAMKVTAQKDTFGYSMRRWVGLENYKKYGYVPADLEYISVSKTLEYAYDDWCLAQMAKMLNKNEDYKYFLKRSKSYRKVFDTKWGFMRGRKTDGTFTVPFHPRASSHYMDDYAEGTAWQWTFFVPHDVDGLAQLLGGKEKLSQKLDTLFSMTSELVGDNPSVDIEGMLGQYAHGNEPGHHTIYMYNFCGKPNKTQELSRYIMENYYKNRPEAYPGNEDTGQMASWYVWNAMGIYPFTHGNGVYAIGSPVFDKITVKLGGKDNQAITIETKNNSPENKFIQAVYLNGAPYRKPWFKHNDLIGGSVVFIMGDKEGRWFN